MILRTFVFSGISMFYGVGEAVRTLRKAARRARDMSGMGVQLLPMPVTVSICINIPVHRQPIEPAQPTIRKRLHQKGRLRVLSEIAHDLNLTVRRTVFPVPQCTCL
jgi:hypothetical protein